LEHIVDRLHQVRDVRRRSGRVQIDVTLTRRENLVREPEVVDPVIHVGEIRSSVVVVDVAAFFAATVMVASDSIRRPAKEKPEPAKRTPVG